MQDCQANMNLLEVPMTLELLFNPETLQLYGEGIEPSYPTMRVNPDNRFLYQLVYNDEPVKVDFNDHWIGKYIEGLENHSRRVKDYHVKQMIEWAVANGALHLEAVMSTITGMPLHFCVNVQTPVLLHRVPTEMPLPGTFHLLSGWTCSPHRHDYYGNFPHIKDAFDKMVLTKRESPGEENDRLYYKKAKAEYIPDEEIRKIAYDTMVPG